MKGIEIFLITRENNKACYKMELSECEYDDELEYDVMFTFKGGKEGVSLIGEIEEKEVVEKKLKLYYKATLEDEINKLKEELKMLEDSKIEIERLYGV